MPRYRRMSAIHPVNRIKHVFDDSATVTAGVLIGIQLVKEVVAPVLANTNEVLTASKVNGIYLKVEVSATETLAGTPIPNVYMAIYKDDDGTLGNIDPTNVGANAKKKNVIHQEMIMLNNTIGGNPRVLFNGVVVIPKGMRRFGPAGSLKLTIKSTALDFAYCLQSHYKEFR